MNSLVTSKMFKAAIHTASFNNGYFLIFLLPILIAGIAAIIYFYKKKSNKTLNPKTSKKLIYSIVVCVAVCLAISLVVQINYIVKAHSINIEQLVNNADVTSSSQAVQPEIKLGKTIFNVGFEDDNLPFSVGSKTSINSRSDDNKYCWNIEKEMKPKYLGNKDWTDYSVSADIRYTEIATKDSKVTLMARVLTNSFYGDRYYAATILEGNKLTLTYHRPNGVAGQTGITNKTIDIENSDGLFHNLRIDVIDNNVMVYWDNKLMLFYNVTCGVSPQTGKIGLAVENTNIEIDNIVVNKILDPKGGDDDNILGGKYDE